jgi:recombination protein RecA
MAQKNTGHKTLAELMGKMEPADDAKRIDGNWPAYSFGHPLPDRATKIMGLPKGKIVEIFGQENCGKSLMTLHAIKGAQAEGKMNYILDSEDSYDEKWLHKNGVSTEPHLLKAFVPDTLEEALEFCDLAAQEDNIGIIMIDSLANLVSTDELNVSIYEEARVGGNAKKIKSGLRRIVRAMARNHSEQTVVIINQLYDKVAGGMTPRGNTGGGKAIKYNSAMRIMFRKIQQVEGYTIDARGNKVKQRVGDLIEINVMKNKVAPQNGITQFVLRDDIGLDVHGDVVDLAIENKLITGSGWYTIPAEYHHTGEDGRIQGKDNIYTYYRGQKAVFDKLEKDVFDHINIKNGGNKAITDDDDDDDDDLLDDTPVATPKKKAGRPKKVATPEATGIVDLGA